MRAPAEASEHLDRLATAAMDALGIPGLALAVTD